MHRKPPRVPLIAVLLMIALGGPLCREARAQFELTIFHANDGESALIGDGPEGGAARFVEVLRRERFRAGDRATLTISSGDNYLAGRQLTASIASLEQRGPFYDAAIARAIDYDAVVIGNHEFDFGPELLGRFIERCNTGGSTTRFLSANLDFSKSAMVSDEAKAHIGASAVFTFGETSVGLVAATTPLLPSISSPGDIAIQTDVAAVLQSEIDRLTANGVSIIILASHLQSVFEDAILIGQLRGVDFAIAGGGDELLASPGVPLLPRHQNTAPMGPYPLTSLDLDGDGTQDPIVNADGDHVPVVTTSGHYHYLGRITLHFDKHGRLTRFTDPGPVRVVDASTGLADAVVPDPTISTFILEPVERYSASLDRKAIGVVGAGAHLDGKRTSVRTRETGLGNLIADAIRASAITALELDPSDQPVIGVQNGGGIRNNVELAAGNPITVGNTFDALPFPNFISAVKDVDPETLRATLENAVSRVENGDGRFLQVSGFSFEYDLSGRPMSFDRDGGVVQTGQRVRRVVLNDGTVLVERGAVVSTQPVTVAVVDFTARGGDQHDFGPISKGRFERSGVTYQKAVEIFVRDSLGGTVTGPAYAERGEGRITATPAPAADAGG